MKILKILKKQPLLLVFGVTWIIKIVHSNLNFSPLNVSDPDRYFSSFNYFLKNNYYDIMANGSSYLFNLVNAVLFKITDNVSVSFFITNLISEILVLIIGLKIIFIINKKFNSKYVFVIALFYAFNTLDLNDYHHSNNDVFQAVFIALGILLLVKQFYLEGFKKSYYIWLAFIVALCTLIRPTSLVVIVLSFMAVFFIECFKKSSFLTGIKRGLFFLIPLIVLISLFHYPALKEHGKLGFYNKSTTGNNWVQRNYLGTKRMQTGELPLNKNSIFRDTKFSDVAIYLKENGKNSLPKTQGEFLKKDPVLSILIVVYNVVFTFLKGARYYAFLLILPLLFLVYKPIISKDKWLVYLWGLIIGTLSFIPFTLMEYRWYTGYDILFILTIFSAITYFENSKYKKYLKYSINSS